MHEIYLRKKFIQWMTFVEKAQVTPLGTGHQTALAPTTNIYSALFQWQVKEVIHLCQLKPFLFHHSFIIKNYLSLRARSPTSTFKSYLTCIHNAHAMARLFCVYLILIYRFLYLCLCLIPIPVPAPTSGIENLISFIGFIVKQVSTNICHHNILIYVFKI